MTWDDVRQIAVETAAELSWGDTSLSSEPLLLERVLRKVLREPRRESRSASSRLVMVVPTQGVEGSRDGGPADRTTGWAVRLLPDGKLEYLRFQAFTRPRWDERFPLEAHELEPFTPGADHWTPLDREQLTKTDLDWSPSSLLGITHPDGSREWAITPSAKGGRSKGSGLAAALAALRAGAGAEPRSREIDVRGRTRTRHA